MRYLLGGWVTFNLTQFTWNVRRSHRKPTKLLLFPSHPHTLHSSVLPHVNTHTHTHAQLYINSRQNVLPFSLFPLHHCLHVSFPKKKEKNPLHILRSFNDFSSCHWTEYASENRSYRQCLSTITVSRICVELVLLPLLTDVLGYDCHSWWWCWCRQLDVLILGTQLLYSIPLQIPFLTILLPFFSSRYVILWMCMRYTFVLFLFLLLLYCDLPILSGWLEIKFFLCGLHWRFILQYQ